jgi:hypothetical protein
MRTAPVAAVLVSLSILVGCGGSDEVTSSRRTQNYDVKIRPCAQPLAVLRPLITGYIELYVVAPKTAANRAHLRRLLHDLRRCGHEDEAQRLKRGVAGLGS